MKNKTKILIAVVALMMVGFSSKSFAQRVHANINFSIGTPGYYAPAAYTNVGYYNNGGYYNNAGYYGRECRRGWGRDGDRYRGERRMMYRENGYAYRDRERDAQRYNGYNNYGYNGYRR
ncbi:MAG: hypothetical protein ACTHJ0_13725 [Flavipsychrobacter sp.]